MTHFLFSFLFSTQVFAADPFFIEYGVIRLSDSNPSVELPLKVTTQWVKDFIVPELVFIRTDIGEVEKELTPVSVKQGDAVVCTPTVRVLLPEGYVGLNSITYGGRVRANGSRVTVKAVKTCGKVLTYKVRIAAYWNASLQKQDFPSDLVCTTPNKEGWCRN